MMSDGRLFRGHHTRARLVESAVLEFATVGFEGASLRAVAKRARTAFQLVSYHFGGKEELWKTVVQHLFEQEIIRNASLNPPRNSTPDDQLRSLLKSAILRAQRNSTFLRIVTLEGMDASERYEKTLRPMCQTLRHSLDPVLNQFKEFSGAGALSATEARLLYNGFIFTNALLSEDSGQLFGKPLSDPAAVEAQVELLASTLQTGRGNHSAGRQRTIYSIWPKGESETRAPSVHLPEQRLQGAGASPDKLLLAAIDVFAEKGYHASSVREIADRAGVAFQLIRYHFGSKPNLWLTALIYLMDQRLNAISSSHFTRDGNHEIELEIWLRRSIFYSFEESKLPRIMTRERFSDSSQFTRYIRPRIANMRLMLSKSYREMHDMQVLRGVSVEQAALLNTAMGPASAMQPLAMEMTTGWVVTDPRCADLLVGLLARVLTGRVQSSESTKWSRARIFKQQ